MWTRHRSLYAGWLGAIGCSLAAACGCSPEYELLSSASNEPAGGNGSRDEPSNAAVGSAINGGAGNAASPVSGSGGVVATAAGGESAVGGEDVGGSAAAP